MEPRTNKPSVQPVHQGPQTQAPRRVGPVRKRSRAVIGRPSPIGQNHSAQSHSPFEQIEVIRNRGFFSPYIFSMYLGQVVVPGFFAVIIADWVASKSRPLGMAVFAILCIAALFWCFINTWNGLFDDSASGDALDGFGGGLAGAGILLLFAYSQLCRSWYLAGGDFQAAGRDFWYWVRFGVQGSIQGGVFDFAEVFEWRFSEIRANSMWSRAIVVSYRVIFELIVLSGVIRVAKAAVHLRAWKHIDPLEENFGERLAGSVRRMLTVAVWMVPLISYVWASIPGDISVNIVWEHIQVIMPKFVGIWLATTSIQAFLSPGVSNKIGGPLGLMVSTWILWNSRDGKLF
jgi:hypothetical protein